MSFNMYRRHKVVNDSYNLERNTDMFILWLEGWSGPQIAKNYGVSNAVVRSQLTGLAYDLRIKPSNHLVELRKQKNEIIPMIQRFKQKVEEYRKHKDNELNPIDKWLVQDAMEALNSALKSSDRDDKDKYIDVALSKLKLTGLPEHTVLIRDHHVGG